MYTLLLSLFLVGTSVLARPDGAPAAACEDLLPQHNTTAQTDPAPYSVMVMPMMDHYMVTISGSAPFRGFYIQARSVAGGTTPQGYFADADPVDLQVQFTECAGVVDGAATHVINVDKTSVTFRWFATDVPFEEVTFSTTVVQTTDVFWTGLSPMIL